MKKLMIVAAAAAMVGVAEAENYSEYGTDLAYDFTMTVKTTKGAKGKDQKTNYTVNLGVNDDGFFWYDKKKGAPVSYDYNKGPKPADGKTAFADVILQDGSKAKKAVKFTYNKKGVFQKAELVLTGLDDDAKEAIALAFGFDGKNTDYNNKSMKKWCQTFKFTHTVNAACYRVACSKTFKGVVEASGCCALGNKWEYYQLIDKNNYADGVEITNLMLYRFGGQTVDKATKVEYVGQIGNVAQNIEKPRLQPNFMFAGQGAWSDKLCYYAPTKSDKVYLWGVKDISGNIVGTLPPPDCEECCNYGAQAIAFYCYADFYADDDDAVAWKNVGTKMMPTAAFGTWSMKFNKSMTAAWWKADRNVTIK